MNAPAMFRAWPRTVLLACALLVSCGGGADGPPVQSQQAVARAPTQAVPRASAVPMADLATIVMDWGEGQFPGYFPSHQGNAVLHPFLYRYYPETGIYLGVVTTSAGPYVAGDVYVMGGPFGSSPRRIAPLTNFLVTNYFVDGPVNGIRYACAPSGLSGSTAWGGAFTCRPGETVTFTVSAGAGGTVTLGITAVPAANGIAIPVTVLPNGLLVAEILQALNHGTTADMDVTGLTLPPAAVAAINAYIASGGTNLAGQASDDQFLAWIQGQAGGPALTTHVTGAGLTFRQGTVLPNLQASIIAISQSNPPPVLRDNTTRLSGTIVVSGNGNFQTIPGCPDGTLSFSGGGILNAVISGDIQVPGVYQANWSSPGFLETVTITVPECVIPGNPPIVLPGDTETQSFSVPPIAEASPLTVTAAFSGTNLALPAAQAPAGCVAGAVNGTNLGLANPLVTLSTQVACVIAGANINAVATMKLVGSW